MVPEKQTNRQNITLVMFCLIELRTKRQKCKIQTIINKSNFKRFFQQRCGSIHVNQFYIYLNLKTHRSYMCHFQSIA